ncbi:hypothetical protein CVT25_011545 [Psilocybe cyanescens]|uniref:Uncharacterized protein n=1 Tax=Psilocybe cyanescens TaxID=93625 RepID=A0A409XCA6_PSICY|nr:hypothetical protein CVT25_011545 [Psilocybe cyanescens]
MPNPGAFCGARKDFLLNEKKVYSLGVAGHYCFPLDLPDDQDPSPEDLAAVNNKAPQPEQVQPDENKMTPDEYSVAILALKTRQTAVDFKKVYIKDNNVNPKDPNTYNPYKSLIAKLSGSEISKPCMKTAANIWRKDHRSEIEEVKVRSEREGLTKSDQAALRDSIAQHLFLKLPKEEQ